MKKKLLSFIPIYGMKYIFEMDEMEDNFQPISFFFWISCWYHSLIVAGILILITELW